MRSLLNGAKNALLNAAPLVPGDDDQFVCPQDHINQHIGDLTVQLVVVVGLRNAKSGTRPRHHLIGVWNDRGTHLGFSTGLTHQTIAEVFKTTTLERHRLRAISAVTLVP
jgi:hypothetical protein